MGFQPVPVWDNIFLFCIIYIIITQIKCSAITSKAISHSCIISSYSIDGLITCVCVRIRCNAHLHGLLTLLYCRRRARSSTTRRRWPTKTSTSRWAATARASSCREPTALSRRHLSATWSSGRLARAPEVSCHQCSSAFSVFFLFCHYVAASSWSAGWYV